MRGKTRFLHGSFVVVVLLLHVLTIGQSQEVSDKTDVTSCGGILNCETCQNPNVTCTQCGPRATFSANESSVCVACPTGCSDCYSDAFQGMICIECMPGFSMLQNKTCLQCPEETCNRCKVREEQGDIYCTRCGDGYMRIPNVGTCVPCPPNCRTCEKNGSQPIECTGCDDLFVLDYHNFDCLPCPPECSECYPQLTDERPFCLGCKPGMGCFLTRGTCQKCDPQSDGCTECEDVNDCAQCSIGYTLLRGACKRCPDNCDVCGYIFIAPMRIECQTCEEGYGLRGEIYPVCRDCGIPHCQACTVAGGCETCIPGYTLYNKRCVKCEDENCSWCRMATQGQAQHCSICETGMGAYLFQPCQACPERSCAHCGYTTAGEDLQCWMCMYGYNKNVTTTDTTVSVACVLNDSMRDSLDCPDNCYVCYTSGEERRCHEDGCVEGYRHESGQCVACPSLCQRCEVSEDGSGGIVCTFCDAGYGVDKAGACIPCVEGCSWCEYDEDDHFVCQECRPGHEITYTACIACPPGCAECDNVGGVMICTRCARGLSSRGRRNADYDDTTCYPCPPRCDQCATRSSLGGEESGGGDDMMCTTCESGLHLIGSERQCTPCDEIVTPHCVTCERRSGGAGIGQGSDDDDGGDSSDTTAEFTCTSCEEGYVLKDNGKECIDVSSLAECVAGEDKELSCAECGAGFLVNPLGTCSVHCRVCGNMSTGDWRPESECGIDPAWINYPKEACDTGTCWVHARYGPDDTPTLHARGCMEKPCPDENSDTEYCTTNKDIKICSKCCRGNLCDDKVRFKNKGQRATAADFYLLILAALALISFM